MEYMSSIMRIVGVILVGILAVCKPALGQQSLMLIPGRRELPYLIALFRTVCHAHH